MYAIFYLNKTGSQWRMLPKDFPPHNTFFTTSTNGNRKELLKKYAILFTLWSRLTERNEMPSLGITDFRSIKYSHYVDINKNIDENKNIKGRKEYVVVLGLPLGIVVHKANVHDSVGVHEVIDTMIQITFYKLMLNKSSNTNRNSF